MAAAGAAKKIFDKIPDNVDKQIQNQAKQAHRDRGTAFKIANSIGYLLDQTDLGNQKQAKLIFQIESLKATQRDIFIFYFTSECFVQFLWSSFNLIKWGKASLSLSK